MAKLSRRPSLFEYEQLGYYVVGNLGLGALIYVLLRAVPVFIIAVVLPYPYQLVPPALWVVALAYLTWRYWQEENKAIMLIQMLRSGAKVSVMSGVLKVVAPHGPVEFEPWGSEDEVKPGAYVYVEWEGGKVGVEVGPFEYRKEGGAYFQAWGYKVLEPCCEGVYVVKIDPLKAYSLSAQLSFSTEWGDSGRVAVRPAGPGVLEVEAEAWLVKARSVKVDLVARTEYGSAAVRLLEAREGASRARVDLGGGPSTLIFLKPPYDLRGVFPQGVAGLAPAPDVEYVLKVTLDMPTARDVVFETKAVPTPPGS
ncbi:MAG: hypothetical protein QXP31_00255 [Pyrobaculum sp.]